MVLLRPIFISVLCFIAISCTHTSDYQAYDPDCPNLAHKLGVQECDWLEVRDLISKERDYLLTCVERNPHGYIGAWMATKTPDGLQQHGPVFFYAKHQGHWYRLDEMSEWRDDK
jgi:hypothetical protein